MENLFRFILMKGGKMKKENNAIVITSIISGVILLIAIIAFSVLKNPDSNVVTVQGVSTIKATPDLITVYYNIETKGVTSAEASSANTLIYNGLTDALIAKGFEKEDLKTESFSVYPDISWENGKEKQNGYVASHSLKLELDMDELDKLTSVIDAGTNVGAGISYINFELTQESQNEYKAQALKLASEDAKIKAEAVASGFDKRTGRLISVSVNDFGYYPWNVYTSSSKGGIAEDAQLARESVMNISPSEKDITASVTATFGIW
jgi:hypothetical protein